MSFLKPVAALMLSLARPKSWTDHLALGLAGGLLFIAGWPPGPWSFLLLIAPLPWIALSLGSQRIKMAFISFYLGFSVFHLYVMHWLLAVDVNGLKLLLPLLAILLSPLFWWAPYALIRWLGGRAGMMAALVTLPFCATLQEVMHHHWDLGFTWIQLGLAFANCTWLSGLYPLLGQHGGTWLPFAFSSLVYAAWIGTNRLTIALPLLASVGLLAVASLSYLFKPKFQGNEVPVAMLWPTHEADDGVELQERVVQIENFLNQLTTKPQLLVCPEGFLSDFGQEPLILNNLDQHPAMHRLLAASQQYGVPILTGAMVLKLYQQLEPPTATAVLKKPGLYYDAYNAALFIKPDGTWDWRSKQWLVPFAEKVPFVQTIKALDAFHFWPQKVGGSFATHSSTRPLEYGNLRIAPLICYESVFPRIAASYLSNGANLLVQLNTDWTNSATTLNHQWHYTRAASLAFNRDVLVCGTKLYSGVARSSGELKPWNGNENYATLQLQTHETAHVWMAKNDWIWAMTSLVLILTTLIYSQQEKNLHLTREHSTPNSNFSNSDNRGRAVVCKRFR